MMRGGGKTTIAECAALRAILYGLRCFAVMVQATEKLAGKSLRKIRRELEKNNRLLDDFPEVIYPIRQLKGIHNRARGQTLCGVNTAIEWTGDGVTLPTVAGSRASGSVLHIVGITGSIKGLAAPGPDGEIMRPDLLIIDDCQTRDSANSPTQTSNRESIVMDDLLGLAGPETEIAAVFLCTPIYVNDLTERFLDHDRHPEWGGVRTKMIVNFPNALDLWDQYAEIRRESQRMGGKGQEATDFYLANREAMDEGAVLSWPDRKKKGEVSGLQGAMNLYYRSPRGFHAEYNCQPEVIADDAATKELIPAEVMKRFNGVERYAVPSDCSLLTAFLDPGVWALWYAIVGWNEHFGGSVIDVGCWPRQGRTQFAADDCRPNLRAKYPGYSDAQLVFASLRDLSAEILGRNYFNAQTGGVMKIERCLVDAGWEPDAVFQFVQASSFSTILTPSKGIGRSPTARGVTEWQPRPGERKGTAWRMTKAEKGRGQQCQFDPDYWKSEIFAKLTVPQGGKNALRLWGTKGSAHEMLADHLASETGSPVTIRGATFDKWVKKQGRDNHWLDTTVGSAVAASVVGLKVSSDPTAAGERKTKKKPIKLSELYEQKHGYGRG